MTSRRFALLCTLAIVSASCERRGESAESQFKASQAVGDVMTYPQSTLMTVSSGNEAAEVVLTTSASPENVAAWYRVQLPRNDWAIKTDTRDRTGTTTIYAERGAEQKPLWITLQPSVGAPGTTYKLVGVFAIDSLKRNGVQ